MDNVAIWLHTLQDFGGALKLKKYILPEYPSLVLDSVQAKVFLPLDKLQ